MTTKQYDRALHQANQDLARLLVQRQKLDRKAARLQAVIADLENLRAELMQKHLDREIDQVIKAGERKDAKVAKPVPLFWVYVTAWATPDNVVQFREDIYNRDGLGQYAASRG